MKNYRKRFYWNIVQLAIGFFLLLIVFLWISRYPAERKAFKIQFGVLYDQVKVLYYSLFTNVGDKVKKRQQLQRTLDQFSKDLKESKCLTGKDLEDFRNFVNKIKNLSVENYLNNTQIINQKIFSKLKYIRINCPEVFSN